MKLIDTILEVEAQKMPPTVEFVEGFIKSCGIDPIRWAIIEINDNRLTLSVCGKVI